LIPSHGLSGSYPSKPDRIITSGLPTIRESSSGSSNGTPSAAPSAIERIRDAIKGHTEECREAGSEEQLLEEVRQCYNGKVVVGHDLEIF
jgi:hypothetical protein